MRSMTMVAQISAIGFRSELQELDLGMSTYMGDAIIEKGGSDY